MSKRRASEKGKMARGRSVSLRLVLLRLLAHSYRSQDSDLAQRQGERGQSFHMITFKGTVLRSLRKTALQEIHIHSCKPFLVNALRKGGQGPMSPCQLEQAVNAPGSSVLSQACVLMGGWGHPKDAALCCPRP